MPLGPMIVNYGNVSDTFLLQVNIGTPGAITLSQTGTTTVNVPGLLTTDQISTVSKPTNQAGLIVAGGICLTNGVLTVIYANPSIAGITPTANEIYTIEVNRPAQLPLVGVIQ
jgi:hypothetical protein